MAQVLEIIRDTDDNYVYAVQEKTQSTKRIIPGFAFSHLEDIVEHYENNVVVVEVSGGVAEVTKDLKKKDISVIIVDHDNLEE